MMRLRELNLGRSSKAWTHGIVLFALFLSAFAGVRDTRGDVLVEAHRGDSLNAPENTISSIQSAAAFADLTEMDVRITADGELVLMHDTTVDRSTDGTGWLAGMTLAQLQTFDAGSWFSPAFAGEPVPTMAEAIAASQTANILPLVERKTGSSSAYHTEFQSLSLASSDFRVIAFDWAFLNGLDALDSTYNLGALGSGTITQAVITTAAVNGADFLDWSHANINQASLDLVHANGMELHAYTVNDPIRMQQLIDIGVDGITTDIPEVLHNLLLPDNPVLFVDRDTGEIRLENVETAPVDFKGYSLTSTLGALDPIQWLSITDNYDTGSPGPEQIDPDNNWTEQSSLLTDLSEAELEGGDGASLIASDSVRIGDLGAWLASPLEDDLQMELTLPGGATQNITVVYEGNGGNPFDAGDFDTDGDIDADDWLTHNTGRGSDLSGLSLAQGYNQGDIDWSGTIDVVDFVLFKAAFEAANGAGSFATMISVPEPSALLLLLFGALCLGIVSSRRCHTIAPKYGVFSVLILLAYSAERCQATTIGFIGAAAVNAKMPTDYGSNAAADGTGWTTSDGTGATPDVTLNWPLFNPPSVPGAWEFHNAVTFSPLENQTVGGAWDRGVANAVAQIQAGPQEINFSVPAGIQFVLNSFDIGNATDLQPTEGPYGWELSLVRDSDVAVVWSHSTALFGPGEDESVVVNYLGDAGEDYTLNFVRTSEGNGVTFRSGIDNLSFSEMVVTDPLSMRINRGTGEVFLENNSGSDISIDSYEITSLSGSLDPIAWNSLEDQDFEGNGSPGTGNGWEEAGGVNTDQLIESYLLGESLIADTASISLGNAFDFDKIGVDEDVLFGYHVAGGQASLTSGTVSFFGDADFNSDGDVDGADFLTWQRGAGSAGGLPQGDADGDGLVDGSDLAIWQGLFGTTSGVPPLTAVPEPSSIVLVAFVLVGLCWNGGFINLRRVSF